MTLVAEPDVQTPRTDAAWKNEVHTASGAVDLSAALNLSRQLERENTDLRRQLTEGLRPTQNIIATYDPPNPSALLHDQVFAVLQRLEAALAAKDEELEKAEREHDAAADAAVRRVADSAEALRRMAIAADGWAKTAKASAQKLAAIDAALRSETRERKE